VDFAGRQAEWGAEECGLEYRSSQLPAGFIITELRFRGAAGNSAEIRRKMDEILAKKNSAQLTDARTAGSTFKNPPLGAAAWQKIKNAFPNGLEIGGARISDKHANFIIAGDNCSSANIENLIREIQDKTSLALEIKILG
jgi:UDP-N-acetylmuramate dehydrogenase